MQNRNTQKYDEVEISNNTYFVLNYNKEKNETTYCMKDILSREDVLKYFTDVWYQELDGSGVRLNSDVSSNKFEDSYICKILNSAFKEDKLKRLNVIGNVRLLSLKEINKLDEKHRNIKKAYWTMTANNCIEWPFSLIEGDLSYGAIAIFYLVWIDGSCDYNITCEAYGVRPVFTIKGDLYE